MVSDTALVCLSYRSDCLQKAISNLYLSEIQSYCIHMSTCTKNSSTVSVMYIGECFRWCSSLHWFLLMKQVVGLLAPVLSYSTLNPKDVTNGSWKNVPVIPRCHISTTSVSLISTPTVKWIKHTLNQEFAYHRSLVKRKIGKRRSTLLWIVPHSITLVCG